MPSKIIDDRSIENPYGGQPLPRTGAPLSDQDLAEVEAILTNLFKDAPLGKYDPDQARAPKGSEAGGEWTDQGGSASDDPKAGKEGKISGDESENMNKIGLDAETARGCATEKEFVKRYFRAIYHHTSDKSLTDFNFKNGQGAWFTSDPYAYARRSQSTAKLERYINPYSLNFASDKEYGPLWQIDAKERNKILLKQGFDGYKHTVDGDVHYLIFRPEALLTKAQITDFYQIANRRGSSC